MSRPKFPLMFNLPSNTLLKNLFRLLPTNMMAVWAVLVDYTPFELFGLSVTPYIFMPLAAIFISTVILPFIQKSSDRIT